MALKHHSSPPLIWVGLVTSWWPNLSWVKNLKSGEVFNVISIYNICVPPNRLRLPCTSLIPSPDNPSCPVLKPFLPSFSASWFISENITCRVHCAFHHLFVPLEVFKGNIDTFMFVPLEIFKGNIDTFMITKIVCFLGHNGSEDPLRLSQVHMIDET